MLDILINSMVLFKHIISVATLTLLLAFFAASAGCDDSHRSRDLPPSGKFRVIPIHTVLHGDAALLASQLGMQIGGIKIQYQGPKKVFRSGYEIWRNGNIVQNTAWVYSSSVHPSKVRTVTFSKQSSWVGIDDTLNSDSGLNGPTYRFSIVSHPGGSFYYHITAPQRATRYIKARHKPLLVEDDQTPAVFAFIWDHGYAMSFSSDESIIHMAKRVDFAIVLRVGFLKQMPR